MWVQLLVCLSALASGCVGLTPNKDSRTSQLERDPLLLFNDPSQQFTKETKKRIPHDERIYRLWNQHFDFNDKEAINQLDSELEDLQDQLMEQLLLVQRRSLRIRNSLSSRTRPLEYELLGLRNDLFALEQFNLKNLDSVELQGQAHSLRNSISALEVRLNHILHEAIQLEEFCEDISQTLSAISSTQASITCPEEWMSYFKMVRTEFSGHQGPFHGKWGKSSKFILAEDLQPGDPQLGTSLEVPSRLDSSAAQKVSSLSSTEPQLDNTDMEVTHPNLPFRQATSPPKVASSLGKSSQNAEPEHSQLHSPKTSTFTIAIKKQHAIIAGAVTLGLAIGGLITWAWHKLKAKRERKNAKLQRRHQRQWSTS